MVTGRVDGGPDVRAWTTEGISATASVVSREIMSDGRDGVREGTHRDLPLWRVRLKSL